MSLMAAKDGGKELSAKVVCLLAASSILCVGGAVYVGSVGTFLSSLTQAVETIAAKLGKPDAAKAILAKGASCIGGFIYGWLYQSFVVLVSLVFMMSTTCMTRAVSSRL